MTTTTINTAELTGAALDWAVGHISGYTLTTDGISMLLKRDGVVLILGPNSSRLSYSPSTNPAYGHPIIELEGIATRKHSSGTWYAMAQADLGDRTSPSWQEFTWRMAFRRKDYPHEEYKRRQRFAGRTMLEAAMRCHAYTRLGPTIDVPTELAP